MPPAVTDVAKPLSRHRQRTKGPGQRTKGKSFNGIKRHGLAPHIRPLRPALALAERLKGPMDSANFLDTVDRVCGQFAAALQHAGPQIYATIAIVVVLSALLFPPQGGPDPDQI